MHALCRHCGFPFQCDWNRINRAQSIGANLYCGRECTGLARRKGLTEEQRIEAKRLYDVEYRAKNLERIKAGKAAWFRQAYDPKAAAVERKKTMARHIEYCRRPEYKAWKSEYDQAYKAKKNFGDFADAFLVLQDIEKEIEQRATRYEIYMTNGTINKAQSRRRSL